MLDVKNYAIRFEMLHIQFLLITFSETTYFNVSSSDNKTEETFSLLRLFRNDGIYKETDLKKCYIQFILRTYYMETTDIFRVSIQ